MSNINTMVSKALTEGRLPNKFTKDDIMTPDQMAKLLKPECVQKGEEFECQDLGYDREADLELKKGKSK